ncbi:hypothetical protein N665_0191s0022 [Sinapis alba]|nr:hypothetical protein N665_0191s0022 [Sinapis alba]
MAITNPSAEKKNLFMLFPFWQKRTAASSSLSPTQNPSQNPPGRHRHRNMDVSKPSSALSVSSVARSILPARRRLRLDPSSYLYFPYEAGKQFQTTAPKSCFMRPPGGVLAPGESVFATVFKFVEHPENNEKQLLTQKSKAKFKIMSLKVNPGVEFVHDLFDEQKDQVTVERVLRVIFLDAERPSAALEKLKLQLDEAQAAVEERKKPLPETGPRVVGEGLVIDEWKERREKYLARQQVEAIDFSS